MDSTTSDEDECILEVHECHFEATCINTIGSYICACNEGFTENEAKVGQVTCMHAHMTFHGLDAECYFLGTTIFNENECVLKNYTCDSHATCNNANGSFTCTCIEGFTGNGTVCKGRVFR